MNRESPNNNNNNNRLDCESGVRCGGWSDSACLLVLRRRTLTRTLSVPRPLLQVFFDWHLILTHVRKKETQQSLHLVVVYPLLFLLLFLAFLLASFYLSIHG